MKEQNLQILLSIIKNNGDVRRLKREGLDYIDIAELTNQVISTQLASYTDETIALTAKGHKKLLELEQIIKKTNKKNWIDKELKSQIPRLDKSFIFLPNQKELDF